jgi:prophage antirepressor-like protein
VARDLTKALGYQNTSDAIKQHCRKDGLARFYPIKDALGRTQDARVINEPDLYRLIVGSKLPLAAKFEQWVFEEVLPSIRKTGSYSVVKEQPDNKELVLSDEHKEVISNLNMWLLASTTLGVEIHMARAIAVKKVREINNVDFQPLLVGKHRPRIPSNSYSFR